MPWRNSALFAVLCGYVVWTILNHEVVQAWLGPIADQMGRAVFYTLAAVACASTGLGLSFLLWRNTSQHPAGKALRWALAMTILASGLAACFLTVNNAELAHFPQYAIFGATTYYLCRRVGESVAWATLVGLADEGYQYFVLHSTWGIPWDFNDVTLDLIGGAFGAIFAATYWRAAPAESLLWHRPGLAAVAAAYLCGVALLLLGRITLYQVPGRQDIWFSFSRLRPQGFWFFDATWGPRTIHMLSPLEGLLLFLLLIAAYAQVDRQKYLSK